MSLRFLQILRIKIMLLKKKAYFSWPILKPKFFLIVHLSVYKWFTFGHLRRLDS